MLSFALFFGQLMRKLNQPSVIGELIGGIVLGPTILGFFAPNIYHRLFPINANITQERDILVKVGMLFFLFSAGLEISLAQVQQRKWKIVFISTLGCAIPFCLGFGSVILFPAYWSYSSLSNNIIFALFIGTALSISALPVITRILMDLHLFDQEIGIIVISSATIDDLVGWSLFAVLLGNLSANHPERNLISMLSWIFLFSVLILGFGQWIGQAFFRWARNSLPWPSSLISMVTIYILLAAATAEILGIHSIFGAFLVGVSLHSAFKINGENHTQEIIYQFIISFFAPLYFVSIGLKANFWADFDLQLVLLVLGIATIGKVGGASLGALLAGLSFRDSLAIGFGMNARGAIEMILASVALEYKLIDQRIFVALVIMALVTSIASGPLMQQFIKKPP